MKNSEKIWCTICLIIFIWFIASFIDVNAHNMTDHNYATWNMFDMLCRIYFVG